LHGTVQFLREEEEEEEGEEENTYVGQDTVSTP
jgi:hypothetical protein